MISAFGVIHKTASTAKGAVGLVRYGEKMSSAKPATFAERVSQDYTRQIGSANKASRGKRTGHQREWESSQPKLARPMGSRKNHSEWVYPRPAQSNSWFDQ